MRVLLGEICGNVSVRCEERRGEEREVFCCFFRLFFFFLLLQKHGFAEFQSVSDGSSPSVPASKRLELEILLGPQDHVTIFIL